MKWRAKPLPQHGATRWTVRFAFLPVRCNDGFMRWLCDVYVRQEYQSYEDGGTAWVPLEYSVQLPGGGK